MKVFLLLLSLLFAFESALAHSDGIETILFTAEFMDLITQSDLSVKLGVKKNLYRMFLKKTTNKASHLADFCAKHLNVVINQFELILKAFANKYDFVIFLEHLLHRVDPSAWPRPVVNSLIQEYLFHRKGSHRSDFTLLNFPMRCLLIEAASEKHLIKLAKELISNHFSMSSENVVNSRGEVGNLVVFVQESKLLEWLYNCGLDLEGFVYLGGNERRELVSTEIYLRMKGNRDIDAFLDNRREIIQKRRRLECL